MDIKDVKCDENGLIPAIVQGKDSGEVLMLAYMNEDALNKTRETNETWFYSRSRQELWHKGATSGNPQHVENIQLDCDQDALLITVSTAEPARPTGDVPCFHHALKGNIAKKRALVHTIIDTIEHRRKNPTDGTYPTYLFREGIDKVLKKVGEESA